MPAPEYTYDSRLGAGGRYRDPKGRIVKNIVIIRRLERVQAGAKQEAERLARQLVDGEIGLQEFYDRFRRQLKIVHGVGGAIARGGVERMTPSDWGRVGAVSKQQYQLLNNFIRQIESGEQPLDGNVMRRAKMYVDAARNSYFEVRRGGARDAGFTEERRVLSAVENCRTRGGLMGCVELADLGWQPAGSLPRIGQSPCRSNCKCQFEFRKSLLQKTPEA